MTKLRWRYGIIAGLFLAIFASFPQLKMWYVQGDQWNGHYAYNDLDEVAYAAYLRALIDGRPRKNDPYSGNDDSPENPQPESLFSIQFAAPYTVAIPARILGISAPWAMTLAGAFAGFLSALACFWVIGLITEDSVFAAAGSLIVLCGGALAAGEGAIGEILGNGISYPYFPFLRRYIPAVPFPFMFLLFGSVWKLIGASSLRANLTWGAIGFLSFAYLVFSYFYLWTTAAAWLACLTLLYLIFRSEIWLSRFQKLIMLGAACVFPLAAYGYLLSQRADTMDHVQLLAFTRSPDLFRFPEYISVLVLAAILIGAGLKVINLRSKHGLFAISFTLVPIVVFNQQVVTGRSLQPIHYQVFIGNYVAALALVAAVGLLIRGTLTDKGFARNVLSASLGIVAASWGFVECHYTVRVLDEANLIRDRGIPLAEKLVELDGKNPRRYKKTILSIGTIQSDDSPTIAPQNVLWSRHQHVFAGLTWQENKERYYQYLYYQNLDERWLEKRLKNGDFVSMISLFGWGRHTNRLTVDATPLTRKEIRDEASLYKDFIENFSYRDAATPELSYLVVPAEWKVDMTRVDQWYERDGGETLGIYKLYKLKLREKTDE